MSETHGKPENYDTLQQEPQQEHEHITVLRGVNTDGYPKATSVWAGLPTWLLVLVQWLVALGATFFLAAVGALFWPVAAVYYHGIAPSHKYLQAAVAIVAFLVAIILYALVVTVFLIVGLVLWVLWIIKDVNAVTSHTARPKLFHPYYTGLYTFAE